MKGTLAHIWKIGSCSEGSPKCSSGLDRCGSSNWHGSVASQWRSVQVRTTRRVTFRKNLKAIRQGPIPRPETVIYSGPGKGTGPTNQVLVASTINKFQWNNIDDQISVWFEVAVVCLSGLRVVTMAHWFILSLEYCNRRWHTSRSYIGWRIDCKLYLESLHL